MSNERIYNQLLRLSKTELKNCILSSGNMYDNFIPPTFQKSDVSNWKRFLDEEGYVVIENVLDEKTIFDAIEYFWRDWNTVSPRFKRTDPSTWSIQTAPLMFAKGMATFNGFGQCDFMWYLRTRPQIIDIFANIYGTKDLITSFDGFSVFFSKNQKSPKDWWHIDQHPENPEYSIQGAYNFLPVLEDSAGFTLVPGSHRSFTPSPTPKKKDWIQISSNKSETEAKEIFKNGVKLLIPANCFVLWNSKTIHANKAITAPRGYVDKGKLDRLTAYITYVPKTRRTDPAQLEERKNAYKKGYTTSHWPNKVEIKTYPWGFGPTYEARGFGQIIPKLENGEIPKERLKYI